MPTIHLVIKGRVQGVFYRANAHKKALELGITGWVKNTANGDVEAMATGSPVLLNEFTAWCRRGPTFAEVTDVIVTHQQEQWFEDFIILRE